MPPHLSRVSSRTQVHLFPQPLGPDHTNVFVFLIYRAHAATETQVLVNVPSIECTLPLLPVVPVCFSFRFTSRHKYKNLKYIFHYIVSKPTLTPAIDSFIGSLSVSLALALWLLTLFLRLAAISSHVSICYSSYHKDGSENPSTQD